ncbi:amidase family protein [Amycolatopsis thermoflava]|uniref:amidase family protein n=1 Tax=Amycolatopsis thermoflava TaxID=84480 RepID=UPI000419DF4C|nr:amidase family protein [Amycolatopsis thermoflava]
MTRTIMSATADLRAGRVSGPPPSEEAVARADAVDATSGVFLRPGRSAPGRRPSRRCDGTPTTAQSLVLDPGWAAGDAPAVARLTRAGGTVLGRLTTMEFTRGVPDVAKPFPLPRNAWNPEH